MTDKTSRISADDDSILLLDTMSRSAAYRTCRILCHLLRLIVVRFWKLCTSACLILLLLYWFYGGALSLLFFMFSIFGLFYYAQDMFLYYPNQPQNARLFVEQPDRFQLPYENVFVKTKDGVSLNMYFVKQPNVSSVPTILMIHGNAGNIGHRLSMTYCLFKLCHCNILMLEFRGYGKSTGAPSESGLYRDAETALNWLLNRKDVDPKKIFVFGSSLGGAVSIHMTSDPCYMKAVAGLILENTFTSLPAVAKSLFNISALDFLPTFCFKNQYFSEYKIAKISIPMLFLSGQKDELIPPVMMQSLYSLSGSQVKQFVPFQDGTHNDTCACPGYYESIAKFLYEVVGTTHSKPESPVTIEMDTSNV